MMKDCLSPEQLGMFSNLEMSAAELMVADDHIRSCATCREGLMDNEALGRAADSIRDMLFFNEKSGLNCLDYDQVTAYVNETLSGSDRETIEKHLEVCEQCVGDVRSFVEFEQEMEEQDLEKHRPQKKSSKEKPGTFPNIIPESLVARKEVTMPSKAYMSGVAESTEMAYDERSDRYMEERASLGLGEQKDAPNGFLQHFSFQRLLHLSGMVAMVGIVVLSGFMLRQENKLDHQQDTIGDLDKTVDEKIKTSERTNQNDIKTVENDVQRDFQKGLQRVESRMKVKTPVLLRFSVNAEGDTVTQFEDGKTLMPPPNDMKQRVHDHVNELINVGIVTEAEDFPSQMAQVKQDAMIPEDNAKLHYPVATAIASRRPIFKWSSVPNSTYKISLLNHRGQKIADVSGLPDSRWEMTPAYAALVPGRVYKWRVDAMVFDQRRPVSLPEGKFLVVDKTEEVKWVERHYSDNSIALAAVYEAHGLYADASEQLEKLKKINSKKKTELKMIEKMINALGQKQFGR